MQRLYAYVDETGQDTRGRFFLVSVVVTAEEREQAQVVLEQVERVSQKGILKWQRTPFVRRLAYLRAIFSTSLFQGTLFFARYPQTKTYFDLTIHTTAKAILKRAEGVYRAMVWVDGLDKREARRFAKGLRGLKIKVRKVRGLREESDPFLRLADAVAGFMRDVLEGQGYAQELYREAIKRGMIQEV